MSDLKPYPARSATVGNVTVCSAKKYGSTCTYWFFASIGKASCGRDKWVEFDIRDMSERTCAILPDLCSSQDLADCESGKTEYEEILKRDLTRVAEWCATHGVISILSKPTHKLS